MLSVLCNARYTPGRLGTAGGVLGLAGLDDALGDSDDGCLAMKKAKSKEAFGEKLRRERTSAKITLRKFAAQLGVSPTYVSQVEQGNFPPMTAERATKIAEILGGDADEWVALADRIPDDLEERVRKHPKDMPELMRLATGCTPKQFEEIKEAIREIKRKKGQ